MGTPNFIVRPCGLPMILLRPQPWFTLLMFLAYRASIGRWVDNSSNGLQASVGKFKAGVQRLSKADLRKIKSTKR